MTCTAISPSAATEPVSRTRVDSAASPGRQGQSCPPTPARRWPKGGTSEEGILARRLVREQGPNHYLVGVRAARPQLPCRFEDRGRHDADISTGDDAAPHVGRQE